jgi:predicted metal-dependent enzyme (double-stranded beta helix superfamily)
MAYTLDAFAADCRDALNAAPGPEGLEKVRACLETALKDEDFINAHLGPGATSQRDILYEDPELGFCIIAHVYEGAKTSPPHDHGPSWAIYGQAAGVTEMSDWRLVEAPEGEKPGRVERTDTYSLEPGQARIYPKGAIHSPKRNDSTKLIRIEGKNMDSVERDWYELPE